MDEWIEVIYEYGEEEKSPTNAIYSVMGILCKSAGGGHIICASDDHNGRPCAWQSED